LFYVLRGSDPSNSIFNFDLSISNLKRQARQKSKKTLFGFSGHILLKIMNQRQSRQKK